VNAVIKELWNVGLKVTDLDREEAFLREVGASLVLRERVSMVGEEREYAILMLGGVRMLLFETVVFENLVSGGVRPASPMRSTKWTSSMPSTHASARSAPRSSLSQPKYRRLLVDDVSFSSGRPTVSSSR
jgi:hypothetical protein